MSGRRLCRHTRLLVGECRAAAHAVLPAELAFLIARGPVEGAERLSAMRAEIHRAAGGEGAAAAAAALAADVAGGFPLEDLDLLDALGGFAGFGLWCGGGRPALRGLCGGRPHRLCRS